MTASTEGGIGIGLINVPESFAKYPNSGEWILERLIPSKITTREFQVINSTDKPMFVVIYPGAATNLNGNFVGAPRGVANELTSWMTITPQSAKIQAHQTIYGRVTINVPSDALPSMQFGLIWAQTTVGTSAGVTQVNRVGIRMYDPVGDFVVPKSYAMSPQDLSSTTGGSSSESNGAPSTGFLVNKAVPDNFLGIPVGMEWAAAGLVGAIIFGVLAKKFTLSSGANSKL